LLVFLFYVLNFKEKKKSKRPLC